MSSESKDYDEQKVLTYYVWRYYTHLMSDFEKEVGAVMWARGKAELVSSSGAERILEQRGKVDNPLINEALSNGHDAFRRHTVERLMDEYPNEIYINRCPKCNCITKTPKAKQCTRCHHDWH